MTRTIDLDKLAKEHDSTLEEQIKEQVARAASALTGVASDDTVHRMVTLTQLTQMADALEGISIEGSTRDGQEQLRKGTPVPLALGSGSSGSSSSSGSDSSPEMDRVRDLADNLDWDVSDLLTFVEAVFGQLTPDKVSAPQAKDRAAVLRQVANGSVELKDGKVKAVEDLSALERQFAPYQAVDAELRKVTDHDELKKRRKGLMLVANGTIDLADDGTPKPVSGPDVAALQNQLDHCNALIVDVKEHVSSEKALKVVGKSHWVLDFDALKPDTYKYLTGTDKS